MDVTLFEQITSALTVRAICTPLGPDIPEGSTDEDLMSMHCEAGLDPLNNPSRVLRPDGTTKGMVWFEDYAQLDPHLELCTVDQVMQPLAPSEIISSSTTVLDAVHIFGSKPNRFFYVLHINEIVGVTFYRDLFKPLGRLAFLALALEIEDQALNLCQSALINEQCWQSLSDKRKSKAIDLFKLRYGREPKLHGGARVFAEQLRSGREMSDASLLVACTNLVDKATMIWRRRLIPAARRADVEGFFNELKRIRDRCAHPGRDDDLLPKERLAHFVEAAKRMRESLLASSETLNEKGQGPQSTT